MKVIISGGGTGGHIFPAISIANALKEAQPDVEILFVGAKGKMEMEKVPAAGYDIVGLPVAGFHRKLNIRNVARNILFPFKLVSSLLKAGSIIRKFKPDAAVGVGGYASGPVLRKASKAGVPCLIQEQNSYPGVTNKILAARAKKICVAYPNMERFFPAEKIIMTGNPVRQTLVQSVSREEAAQSFGLDPKLPVVLVIGGSLGARSINNGILESIGELGHDVQMIWQTGKIYYQNIVEKTSTMNLPNLKVLDFIKRMDYAYGLADLVISRAGASSISELALLGKPSILVPSPNVSEDHQTKNAMALVDEDAAIMVRDENTKMLIAESQHALNDKERLERLSVNIRRFARPNAANDIAREVFAMIKNA